MRLCVLADVHGNLAALQTVLADAERRGVDGYACREWLSGEQLEYLKSLEPTLEIGEEIQLSHGSPQDRDEYLIFLHQIEHMLEKATDWLTFCGHSHLQFLHDGKKLHGGALEDYPLEDERRYLINPGSVGQPRDRDWRTGYCLVDTTAHLVDQIRLEYDLDATIGAYQESGLPEYSWQRLREGR